MEKSTNVLYNWSYEDSKNRGPLWYVIALSIAVGLIIWGFLTQQYGMSIVIMLVVGFFYFLENNSEDHVAVELTDLGVKVQGRFYDYSKIQGYSIVYSDDSALYLRLQISRRGINVLNLNIDNAIAANVRSILPNYIEENEKQEITFSEKIIHLLKI